MPKNKTIKISVGAVTVRVYPTSPGWTVVYYEPDGTRKRIWRAEQADARQVAETTATRLAGLTAAPDAERAAEIFLALEAQTEAQKILAPLNGSVTAEEILRAYVKNHTKAVTPSTTFSDTVTEFLAAGKEDGWSGRHQETLDQRLGKLTGLYSGALAGLTSFTIDDVLRTGQKRFKWCGRTRNCYRAALSNVLSYAKRRGLLPRDWNEMEFVAKAKETDGEIGIYNATALRQMLDAKPSPDLLPYIVVGAFCGARPSEIARLRWEDFHWDAGELFIGKGKVRTAGHRVAPLGASLRLWITPGKTGPITKLTLPSSAAHALGKLLDRCGVPGVADGLRHSFVSYRLAVTRSMAQVSAETGTSVTTLTRRYCRPVGRVDAEEWFAVRPVLGITPKAAPLSPETKLSHRC